MLFGATEGNDQQFKKKATNAMGKIIMINQTNLNVLQRIF